MSEPAPTARELAEAGALIVGVQRRRAALQAERSGLLDVARPTWYMALFFVVFAGLLVILAPDDERWTASSGAAAIVIAAVALIAALHQDPPVDLTVEYRPEELAQLVGYVEVTDVPGVMRCTALGDRAVDKYLRWREPRDGTETARRELDVAPLDVDGSARQERPAQADLSEDR